MTRPDIDVAELRSVAEQLAAEAAEFVLARRADLFGDGRPHDGDGTVGTKSTRTDPVTVVDTEAERLLRDRLATLRPGEAVLGEEGGGPRGSDQGVTWVLDPIDGTVNFLYGIPAYAVSVGVQVGGVSVAGAVADVTGCVVYSAGRGLGAHVADSSGSAKVLRCNPIDDLSMALVGTGFGYAPPRRAAQAAVLAGVLPHVRDVRRIGSAALDLCSVAAGRLDAHYEHGLNRWDWAAGALIAAEAGATVVLPRTDGPSLTVASAPGIASDLLRLLERLGAGGELPES
ncbi:MAG: inositol monophosphatase family protein [Candidatus Sericytochromatia bacterium]